MSDHDSDQVKFISSQNLIALWPEFICYMIFDTIKEKEDILVIQQDINKLQKWAKTWQMSFNFEKCKIIHFERNNIENEYTMNFGDTLIPHKIEKSLVEKDLGILLPRGPIKPLMLLKRSLHNWEMFRLLYISLVRPHLEYVVPVWNPSLKKGYWYVWKRAT